jgi:DNA-binding response OmpR family regulator
MEEAIVDKRRILLIDDEENFTFFVKRNLEQTGEFEVIVANDGAKGIELVTQIKPDIVLLDIVMPDTSGPDVAEFLLHNPQTKQIPLIFLTAVVTKEETGIDLINEIGGHNFVSKPVDTQTLINSIKMVLEEASKTKLTQTQ